MKKTNEQIKTAAGNYVDHYQLFGYEVTFYHDVSLDNHPVVVIEDQEFNSYKEAYEFAKNKFINEKYSGPAYTREIWVIAEPDWNNDGTLRYQGGLYGGCYNSTHEIFKAKWFKSLDEVFEFLKTYCYASGSMIKSYTKDYLQSIVNNDVALQSIKKTHN